VCNYCSISEMGVELRSVVGVEFDDKESNKESAL
jgi:hypothetical protein